MEPYLKPEVPKKFNIRYESGVEDGLFYEDNLVISELPGEPWVLVTLGSPKILKVTKQEGNVLHTDDGKIELLPVED